MELRKLTLYAIIALQVILIASVCLSVNVYLFIYSVYIPYVPNQQANSPELNIKRK